MLEFYPQIKWVHVATVIASGSLFALRGAGMLAGARWPMWAPLRYLTYAIDTTLLTAALMLATILHQYPFVHGWLTAKVGLLVVYILLGTFALKRGRTPRAKTCSNSWRARRRRRWLTMFQGLKAQGSGLRAQAKPSRARSKTLPEP